MLISGFVHWATQVPLKTQSQTAGGSLGGMVWKGIIYTLLLLFLSLLPNFHEVRNFLLPVNQNMKFLTWSHRLNSLYPVSKNTSFLPYTVGIECRISGKGKGTKANGSSIPFSCMYLECKRKRYVMYLTKAESYSTLNFFSLSGSFISFFSWTWILCGIQSHWQMFNFFFYSTSSLFLAYSSSFGLFQGWQCQVEGKKTTAMKTKLTAKKEQGPANISPCHFAILISTLCSEIIL